MRNVFQSLSQHPSNLQAAFAAETDTTKERFFFDWRHFARPDQVPPELTGHGQPWHTWLLLGGRGSGKTRAGAEWVRVRFDTDKLEINIQGFRHGAIPSIPIIEIRL